MNEIFSSQAFGIMLTFFLYLFSTFLYQKTKFPLFNPLLMSSILLILYIEIAKIDLHTFLTDLSGIQLFLGPLIVSLAIPVVKKIDIIKKNFLVIAVGSIVGAVTSIGAVLILGPMFKLDYEIIMSIVPKASTTPIAIEVSESLGGIKAITVGVVVLTAVIGSVIIPILIKLFKVKDSRVIGLGLGSTCHAVGTAKAIEIDPEAGAISSVALVFTGVITAIYILFL
ncbi:MAG: LrgB family protein [Candidatus Izemoplasmatales bacterium]|nr:LrgB family protein [Candidatus Izemoplasmatales bacterium]